MLALSTLRPWRTSLARQQAACSGLAWASHDAAGSKDVGLTAYFGVRADLHAYVARAVQMPKALGPRAGAAGAGGGGAQHAKKNAAAVGPSQEQQALALPNAWLLRQ